MVAEQLILFVAYCEVGVENFWVSLIAIGVLLTVSVSRLWHRESPTPTKVELRWIRLVRKQRRVQRLRRIWANQPWKPPERTERMAQAQANGMTAQQLIDTVQQLQAAMQESQQREGKLRQQLEQVIAGQQQQQQQAKPKHNKPKQSFNPTLGLRSKSSHRGNRTSSRCSGKSQSRRSGWWTQRGWQNLRSSQEMKWVGCTGRPEPSRSSQASFRK